MARAAGGGSSPAAPALELQAISKSYPGVRAVDEVSLAFAPGEVHALVGENGAGKSTLIKIMAGAVTPDSGEIRVAGRTVRIVDTHRALQLGLGFVHQELNLVPFFDGAENIFLGRPYPRTRFGTVDWAALHRQAAEV
ncbi:MAG TPA: ATP-binding cassette domain-containing protein, partial [Herpetosiphonaceae bacterium]|nr:ATP-binding cassette domain-containing protein [Herpetosiphonaceae bacterium]